MIAELPFLTRDAEPLSVALWRPQERYLRQANEYKGVKLLARYAGAPGYVLSPSKAIRSIEDWKGVKLFCGLRYTCEIAEKFGATPVARRGPEVAETIERKIVDAAFIDASERQYAAIDRAQAVFRQQCIEQRCNQADFDDDDDQAENPLAPMRPAVRPGICLGPRSYPLPREIAPISCG